MMRGEEMLDTHHGLCRDKNTTRCDSSHTVAKYLLVVGAALLPDYVEIPPARRVPQQQLDFRPGSVLQICPAALDAHHEERIVQRVARGCRSRGASGCRLSPSRRSLTGTVERGIRMARPIARPASRAVHAATGCPSCFETFF